MDKKRSKECRKWGKVWREVKKRRKKCYEQISPQRRAMEEVMEAIKITTSRRNKF